MTKKIFHSILLVAGAVLLASLLFIMGCLYEYFGSVEKKQLRDELELASVAVERGGEDYLSSISSERYRLTWIAPDGTVLYDTVTDAESLENHADREEVREALQAARAKARAIPPRSCKRQCTARAGLPTAVCCVFLSAARRRVCCSSAWCSPS